MNLDGESVQPSPRSDCNDASTSELCSSSIPKRAIRTMSARTSLKPSKNSIRSILPVKTTTPIKTPTHMRSSNSSTISVNRPQTPVANKHTLEIQFLNKNKRYVQMKKELVEKQAPVLELYKNLVEIKKLLEELGKPVRLDDIKLVAYSDYKKRTAHGGGEHVPQEVIKEMKQSLKEVPKSLIEFANNLLNSRSLVVSILQNIAEAPFDSAEICMKIDCVKKEGEELQKSFDIIIDQHCVKIEELVSKWNALASTIQSNETVELLEMKLREKDHLMQESHNITNELRLKLETGRTTYEKTINELNGVMIALREQIKKLEHDLEAERKVTHDFNHRNSTNLQHVKKMQAKISKLETDKQSHDSIVSELQKRFKYLQEQIKTKELEWAKNQEDVQQQIQSKENMLTSLNFNKTEFQSNVEAKTQQKVTIEEELQTTMKILNDELSKTQQELIETIKQRDLITEKCTSCESYIAQMGFNQLSKVESTKNMDDKAKDERIQELEDKLGKMEADLTYRLEQHKLIEEDSVKPTEIEKHIAKQQKCLSKYQTILEKSELKLKEKCTEVTGLRYEIQELKHRQEALEQQNYNCPTVEIHQLLAEGQSKLKEIMHRSINNEEKVENYAAFIEGQTQHMGKVKDSLQYRQNMTDVLRGSRQELLFEKSSLTRYSQKMRGALAEVIKEGKMKDRLIRELEDKLHLREKQISKLEKEERELEANLQLTNEKRYKLEEAKRSTDVELRSTKAQVKQLKSLNSKHNKSKFFKPF